MLCAMPKAHAYDSELRNHKRNELRDHFAAKALQSIVSLEYEKWSPEAKADKWAKEGYEIADAMLKAREQKS